MILISATQAQVNVVYDFNTSSEVYTEITGGTVLATATANSGAASIDDVIFNLPTATLPFSFKFDNINYTGLNISSNGFITFGATPPSATGSGTGFVPISAVTGYSGAASAFGRNLNAYFISGNPSQTGELRYQLTGSAPNRKFIIQFKNFRPFATGSVFGQVLNFQIRLVETTNAIEVIYGTCSLSSTGTAQVGLRGPNNTVFFNRKVVSPTNTWATSVQGTTNADVCNYASTAGNFPTSGLIYRFAPSLCPPAQNMGVLNVTQTSAQLTWTVVSGGGTFRVEYGAPGFTQGTGTIINNIATNSVVINGLTINTPYQYYIRQNCGVNGNSNIIGPINFSTGILGEDCASGPMVTVANDSNSCSSTLITSGVSQNGPNAQCSDAIGGNLPNDDSWVRVIAPNSTNSLVFKTTAGSNNDWVMQVWRGCPESGGTMIACDDDDNGTFMPRIILCQNQYVPGETLYVRMWTYSQTNTGNMTLCVYQGNECAIPPVNDECNTSILLPIRNPLSCPGSGSVYTTKYATKSGDGATCQGVSGIYDVWFKFNTANYGDLQVSFSRLTANNLKAQVLFACGDFEVACWNPGDGAHLLSGLNPSADYVLRVWSDSLQWGTFNVCIQDVCSDPTASMSGIQSICKGDSIFIPVNFTGTAPWTFTYTDNGINNYSITTSTTPYYFAVSPASTKTYTPVSVQDVSCFGSVSGNTTVNVINKPVLNSFTPTSGLTGSTVTLHGHGFANVVSVRFNNVSTSGITIVNDSTITVNVPASATTGPVSVTNLSCTIQDGVFTVTNNNNPTFTVNLRLFLEGMYNTNGAMYPAGDGLGFASSVSDSITLKLAQTITPYNIIATKTSFLSVNGIASFTFPTTLLNNSYYLVIKHRNSVETWSKNPVLLNSASQFIDFSVTTP
ncbi:MAG: hypothetical protein ABI772_07180 [Bacteroidota bacterium]